MNAAPRLFLVSVIGFGAVVSHADAEPRDIQIRSVNFTTGVVELHNFGVGFELLTGWRFCTHDEDQVLRYSGFGGLNSVNIPPDDSVYVHFNNDADAPDEINISTIGGLFALPLDGSSPGDAYAMGLYINSSFAIGANIADHVQWSFGGVDDVSADERSDEAETGLVWEDQSEWIGTGSTTTFIRLTGPSAGGAAGSPNVNSPFDYDVLDARPDCQPNGEDDYFDIEDGTSQDLNSNDVPDECEAPATCDGDADANAVVDVNDIAFVIFRLGNTPPIGTDGDINCDGIVDVNDVSYVIFRLTTCTPAPACP